MTLHSSFAPRLLAGFGTVTLLAGIGLFASSRPAHTVGGPVAVAVSNLPLPTLPTDKAAPSQPVGVQMDIPLTDGRGSAVLYTVPAGKRLVIETLSGTSETVTNTPGSYGVLVFINNFSDFAGFSLQPSGTVATGSQAVHLYADSGTTVIARVFRQSAVGDAAGVSLSGYLVNEP